MRWIAVAALLPVGGCASAPAPALPPARGPATVTELFEALGDDAAEARDRAEDELVGRGRAVLPELERLARFSDPERRARVEHVRARIDDRERWADAEQLIRSKVRAPGDRARVLSDLRAADPTRVERGLAALVGWIAWDRFEPPPDVAAPHDLSKSELAAILRPVFERIPLEEDWGPVKQMLASWAGTSGSTELGPSLVRLLSDPGADIRADALQGLTALRTRGVDATRLLTDESPAVRAAAVEYLLSSGPASALREVLHSIARDPGVRAGATRIAMQRQDAYADPLSDALKDPDAETRWGALWLLSEAGLARGRGSDISPHLGAENESLRTLAEDVLVRSDAHEAVRAALQSPDRLVRFHAARTAGRLAQSSLAADVAALLADRDGMVRQAALEALGRLRAVEHAADVARLLDSSLRPVALEALGRIGRPEHAEAAARALGDERDRVATALALARMGDTRGLPALRELMQTDPNRNVWDQTRALLALNRLRAPEAWKGLQESPRVHAAGYRRTLEAMQEVCTAGGLKLKLDESIARRIEQSAYEFKSAHAPLDLLWEMSFAGWSFVLEAGELRVLPRDQAVEFWKSWLEKQ